MKWFENMIDFRGEDRKEIFSIFEKWRQEVTKIGEKIESRKNGQTGEQVKRHGRLIFDWKLDDRFGMQSTEKPMTNADFSDFPTKKMLA